MNLSNIKKIVLDEGKVVIIDGDDALVVMSFNEYQKIRSKNLEMCSSLLESKAPITVERTEPETKSAPQPELEKISSPELSSALPEKPSTDLTLDDLPF